ncbi:hypothetical protein [Fimbriimonas ginsengisoli]|uniref:Double zinc ribbon domain-containing protein n=1 Tax=Fimbriimonas ginsengisoli Gsoil 348 TaxID=661478 RepID=A0A068NYH5_FIMGI|nr:hypothetical protein [Fimbriimonas ginsengisoli]AIE88140.1 hypothetical protein OP10G_4772 [Fimbriimonas ginsengisoli Gsoil 348]
MRLNSEGIRRDELAFTLRNRYKVQSARRIDACLLCRRPHVNEAALCDVCYSTLEGEELELATCWLRGTAP